MKNTIADFRDLSRDRGIEARRRQVRLAPTWLLTNEMGVDGDIAEAITPTDWSMVVFDVPSDRVKSAELLLYVHDDQSTKVRPMHIDVNGRRFRHRQKREKMLTGGWDRMRLPAGCLQRGRNEIVFSDHGTLHVDPGPGGASFRSFDAGRSWHSGSFGADADIQGDYLVRLRLKGFAPAGQITSSVIDLADPDGKGVIAPAAGYRGLRLDVEAQEPRGTAVELEVRSGATPDFDPRHWTPFARGLRQGSSGRFVQWRATLSTRSADATPELTAVTVHAKVPAVVSNGLTLRELEQPAFIRSSYPFTYLEPHPRVTRLVKQYQLESVIAAGETELEQLALLRDWVHSQWLGWQSSKYPYTPPWDPLEILETTKGNWGYGMCTHYGATFAGCAAALGFVSRVVVIDHHCLAEVWSEELQKWILEDAGPTRQFDATYEVDGVPINALELHQYLAAGQAKGVMANKLPDVKVERMKEYVDSFCRFAIPLRNDHLLFAEPAELRHGNRHYHWDGYLWWSDQVDPRYPEYTLQTTRAGDFYWSVNQTRIYLTAGAGEDELEVQFATVTPNLSHFLVQIDGGEWRDSQSPLQWLLQPGDNELAVRSVNVFGRPGRVARARVCRTE